MRVNTFKIRRILSLAFRRRKKRVLIVAIIVTLIITIFWLSTKLLQFQSNRVCRQLMTNAINEICESYRKQQFIGVLCEPLCDTKKLTLTDCPNIDEHNGKDYVFAAKWRTTDDTSDGTDIVLKARTLTTFELIGNNRWMKEMSSKSIIKKAIYDIISAKFNSSVYEERDLERPKLKLFDTYIIEKLISWPLYTNLLNETSLINVWLLIQDNEFFLSKTYGNVFPGVVGTCGHFYGVAYATNVLDYSYFVPLVRQRFLNRIEIAIKVIEFLMRFEKLKPKLELCDIKFSHFGFIGQDLVMIDSDMIYPKTAVMYSISHLNHCDSDSDCHFIDCNGICMETKKCVIDDKDDDLMRICRNIFFMGDIVFGYASVGLLPNWPELVSNELKMIEVRCFKRTQLLTDITYIHKLLIDIKYKLQT